MMRWVGTSRCEVGGTARARPSSVFAPAARERYPPEDLGGHVATAINSGPGSPHGPYRPAARSRARRNSADPASSPRWALQLK